MLKEHIEGLLDGTKLEIDMKSFLTEYLSERFEAQTVLSSNQITRILISINEKSICSGSYNSNINWCY